MKCNDCIYEKMCEGRYEREHCYSFKDKANFVEVVRCKDCEHWHNEGHDMLINQDYGSCTCKYWEHPTEYFEMAENDFCSYGKRREK